MDSDGGEASRILLQLETLKSTKSEIERQISALEAQLQEINLQHPNATVPNGSCPPVIPSVDSGYGHDLSPQMIYRYSRHLLLPAFGVQGQSKLLKSSVLVVGAGGLGSPLCYILQLVVLILGTQYLYGIASLGRLGIVDHDVVELNNMHRQIIHTEGFIGQPKVRSAATACRSINSTIQVVEYQEPLRTSNALEILSKYDIIVDATDNAPSRYMISDCCVVLGKPLVSGAAVGLEGQLTVFNYNGGPCYRCLFPTPPPATACQRCSDSGVLGVVPGVIGCLQALEAIKIASEIGEALSERMLLFDALSGRIRIVKIRGRSLQCVACGENAPFSKQQFQEFDYEKFTQSPLTPLPLKLKLLQADSRINSKEYKEKLVRGEAHVLIDVRPEHHFKIVSLPNSLNTPLSSLEARLPEISSVLKEKEEHQGTDSGLGGRLYVICRRGNDSQGCSVSPQDGFHVGQRHHWGTGRLGP
ncbi:adenylyltransferase and sulfurtransferase MOCS3 [Prunus yedoensis var. nudiflora]|uniref:Adenylyltransferase and sulfurtransferase MOCS3 n=1 Tax=Prunus yedoensis var. nudiflora TaxID=2094558 RepID=A0A314XRP4_PRUYE|nr:adenylyltransferase and sulfurtransferase MOCS3 [Prunus yedoensis var. nudiflora]